MAMRSRHLPYVLLLAGSCGNPDPGQVRFTVNAPSDPALSPLTDPRVATLELRDALQGTLLAQAFLQPGATAGAQMALGLGPVPVLERRDLRLLARDSAGQQVLGLAVTRDVTVRYGDHADYSFDLRRPLFFFGAGARLMPGVPADPALDPGGQIYGPLEDATRLRVIDPNAGRPLLSAYDLSLDMGSQVVAAAGTFDGRSLLAVTLSGQLFVIDTLKLQQAQKVQVPGAPLQAQAVVVNPRDEAALIVHYDAPPQAAGGVGKLTFIPALDPLRQSGDASGLVTVSVASGDPPLAAAWSPDGHWDVVFGPPPLSLAASDCTPPAATAKSVLRRYDARGMAAGADLTLDYTTAVAYLDAGTRALAQPCTQAQAAMRPGQVLVQTVQGGMVTGTHALSAPGTADLSYIAGPPWALVAIGRDDVTETDTSLAHGAVRVMDVSTQDFGQPATFNLDDWQIPYRATVSDTGQPFPGGVDFLLGPRDLLIYRVVVAPDRTRALVAARVTHQVQSMFIDSSTNLLGDTYYCRLDWVGYTYHVQLLNLQTGAREQDFLVGVQNKTCSSHWYDAKKNPVMGHCLGGCDVPDDNGQTYLQGYQEGYVPAAASVLFGKQ